MQDSCVLCHELGSSVIVVKEGSACNLALSILYDLLGGAGGFDLLTIGEAGGVGVEIRSGWSLGIISGAGPIKDSKIGKKNSPFTKPIPTRHNNTKKKYRTMKSNSEKANIMTVNRVVDAPCITGAYMCSRAKRILRSLLPMVVTKLYKNKNETMEYKCDKQFYRRDIGNQIFRAIIFREIYIYV